ncbi:MAG: hypothetical protein ABW120_04020, partial [Sedimenticola sp.]
SVVALPIWPEKCRDGHDYSLLVKPNLLTCLLFMYRMYGQEIASRQLLLHCSNTDILVGMHFLHFRHPWRSYAAGAYTDMKYWLI